MEKQKLKTRTGYRLLLAEERANFIEKRLKAGFTRGDLDRRLGVSLGTLNRIETGAAKNFSIALLERIAKILKYNY